MNINIPNIFTKVVTAALLGSAAICAASFFHHCTFLCQRHIWLRSPLPRSDLYGHRWRHCCCYLSRSFPRLKPKLTALKYTD